jgi:hypothetical protein
MESRFEDDAEPAQASGWPRAWAAVYGRSDARDAYEVFYYDERGVYRVFDMTLAGGEWTQLREDPDLHQPATGDDG